MGEGWGPRTSLTMSGPSVKIEQIIGDCDWVAWDATINQATPTCTPTVSQTATRADVLGNGLGYSFEHDGRLIFLFGDTIGATNGPPNGPAYYPTWVNFINEFHWQGHDPMAWSWTRQPEDGLLLNFFTDSAGSTLLVQPEYPDGTLVDMGPNNIPNSGISLDGQIHIVCSTGATVKNGIGSYANAFSILARFHEMNKTFTAGRTISQVSNGGHFVMTSLHEFPPESGNSVPGFEEPYVLVFGLGQYRQRDIYLSVIPKRYFESGVDENGKNATRYFARFDPDGLPKWSDKEADAVPVVQDNPLEEIGVGLPRIPGQTIAPRLGISR